MSRLDRLIAEAEAIVTVDGVLELDVVVVPAPVTGLVFTRSGLSMFNVPDVPSLVIRVAVVVVVVDVVLDGPAGGAVVTGVFSVLGSVMACQSVTVPWNHVNVRYLDSLTVTISYLHANNKTMQIQAMLFQGERKEGQGTINIRILQD